MAQKNQPQVMGNNLYGAGTTLKGDLNSNTISVLMGRLSETFTAPRKW